MSASSCLDLDKLRATPVAKDPFEHLIVPGFLKPETLTEINRDYPDIDRPGSLPLGSLNYGESFNALISALRGSDLTAVMSQKFDIDLSERPTMITVRARCRPTDGKIHTDSDGKLITVLIYMNGDWDAEGGRLRLLRGPGDIEDYAAEVPPKEGTMLAFKCTENAWHGHRSFDGPRRAIQLNWVVDDRYVQREQRRHAVSALLKKFRFAS